MTLALLFAPFLAAQPAAAQTGTPEPTLDWGFATGGTEDERGSGIVVDGSGNVYTTGYFEGTVDFDPGTGVTNLTSAGLYDFFVQKLDASGNLVWARSMGATGDDRGYAIAVDGSGNVYITGYFNSTVDFDPGPGVTNLTSAGWDIFVQKLDASGNLVWARSMGDAGLDAGYAIAVDGSGNVYTTGDFNGTVDFDPGPGVTNLTAAGWDIFVQKLDASGNFVWAKSMGGTGWDSGYDIAVDGSGNVYTSGEFEGTADFDPGTGVTDLTSAGGTDIFVQKLDASGSLLWARSMGATGDDRGYAIAVDGSGNVYTTGYFEGTVDFDPGTGGTNLTSAGETDFFVQKLDASGNLVWARSMGGTGYDYGESVAVDGSGNVYTTGTFEGTADFDPGAGSTNLTSAGPYDMFVQQLDASGDLIWARSTGGAGSDRGYDIAIAADAVYVTGRSSGTLDVDPTVGTASTSFAGGANDILTFKWNLDGYDYGDLPAGYSQPLAGFAGSDNDQDGSPDGAAAVWAGATVDVEGVQQVSASADGDDTDGVDDEDGLTAPAGPLERGSAYDFTVNLRGNSTNDKYYGLWFDWNNDGDFNDAGLDTFYTNAIALTGTNVDELVSVAVPYDAARDYAVRLMVHNAPLASGDHGAILANGEIEDYVTPAALTAVPDASLSKSVSPSGSVEVGAAIRYTLTVSNMGAYTATGVTVDDALPAGVTGASAVASGITITETSAAPNFAWDVSELAPGASGTIVIAATAPTAFGTITNTASISATNDLALMNNVASASVVVTDTVPPAPPTVTAPISGTVVSTNTPTVAGTAEPSSTVEVKDESGNVVCTTTADAAGNFSCTTDPLPEGPQTLEVTAIDPAGNTSAPTPVDVTVDSGDTTSPAAPTVTGPISGTVVSTNTPTVTGTAEPSSTVEVTDGSGNVVCTTTADAAGNFSCTTAALLEGPQALEVTATDPAGNTSAPTPLELDVDTAPPAAPSITSPADSAVISDTAPTITGMAEPSSTVEVKDESGTVLCTTTADAAGNYSCTTVPLPEGPQTLAVTATDSAGNTSAPTPVDLDVDSTPPAAPVITSPADSAVISDTTPTVTGTGEPGATVELTDGGGTVLCTATVDAGGNWDCTPATPLAEGPHTLTATQTDAVGNTSPASTPVNVTVSAGADSDGDGLLDTEECPFGPPCRDTDGDGLIDSLDPDDDNDGTPTADEISPLWDADDDLDGIPNYLDPDSDGPGSGDSDSDGISDAMECPGGAPCPDGDGNGIPAYMDSDELYVANGYYLPIIRIVQ